MKKHDKVVIIPTYNEAEVISDLIKEVFRVSSDLDVLVVDDNSPDGTGDIVDGLAGDDERVNCLHRAKKEGIGPAYIEGFKWAIDRGYGLIVQMDADFSHDPAYIPRFFELMDKYDVVIGSRYVKGGKVDDWGIIRRLVSRCGSLYAKIILALPINDLTGGFKCFKRKMLEDIGLDDIYTQGYAFQIETTYRAFRKGARIKEFPITFSDRRIGKTKMTRDIILEAIFAVLRMRLRVNSSRAGVKGQGARGKGKEEYDGNEF
jgi:dolichol-phosphate mannosyltransferase